jgi:WD40 repeat protein
MSRVMRWLGRLFGVGALVGAGVLAFHIAKYTPRCVIISDTHIVHFSDDGRTIVTGYTGVNIGSVQQMGTYVLPLRVWDTHSGAVIKEVMAEHESAQQMAFSPDRRWSMADLGKGRLCLVDWHTGEEAIIDLKRATDTDIRGFHFSRTGEWFCLYVPESKQPHELIDVRRREVAVRLEAADYPAMGFSHDGDRFYVRTKGGLKAWNTRSRKFEGEFTGGHAVAFDRDETRVAIEAGKRTLVIWDTATFRPVGRIDDTKTDIGVVNVVFSSTGKRIAVCPRTGAGAHARDDLFARFWDVDTGKPIAQVPVQAPGWGWFTDADHFEFFDKGQQTLIDLTDSTFMAMPWQVGRAFRVSPNLSVHANAAGTWDLVEPATGKVQKQLSLPIVPDSLKVAWNSERNILYGCGCSNVAYPAWLEKWAGRLLGPTEGVVQVVDLAAPRTIFQMRTGLDAAAVISQDASTLVVYNMPWAVVTTPGGGMKVIGVAVPGADLAGAGGAGVGTTPRYRFRFYDLSGNRPWFWAFGTSAGLFVLWLLWRTWRARRARRARSVA